MRRLRVMSKEEQLLRETVRGMLRENDDDAIQQKIKDLDLPQQTFFDNLLSAAGIATDVTGLAANWIPEWAVANIPADLASLGIAWVSYVNSEDRLSRAAAMLAGNSRVSDEERAAILQTYDDFAAMQGLLFAATGIATVFSIADFLGFKLAGIAELGVKVIKITFSVLNILDELTGNEGSTSLYKKMKSMLASAHTELLPIGGVTQLAQAVKRSFDSDPARASSVIRVMSSLAPGTGEQDVKRLTARMKTIDTWAKDFNSRISV